MLSNRFRLFCALSVLILASAACVVPSIAPVKPTSPGLSVQALAATQTVLAAQITITSTPQPLPSQTSVPVDTATEAASLTPTLAVGVFPTETPTLTPVPIFAEVMKETNCRSGPGNHYDLLATFQAGVKLEVEARDLGGGFIFVKNPDKPDSPCYILANNVTLSGDTSILPQYTPLPSPTSAPAFTATFKKFDLCKGNVYAQFVIQNTGSVPFRSAYIRVTNTRNNDVAEQAMDAFDLTTACIIAKNIAPLNAGATGYLSSDVFKTDPRGSKLRAVIQACTEKGLKGTCVTVSLEIKP